ncbi:hypothetical protein PM082_021448 [Marasmius tenuissimus]|nr:hypothetical protein PM082_021448 [Marasmius tenuissimus]
MKPRSLSTEPDLSLPHGTGSATSSGLETGAELRNRVTGSTMSVDKPSRASTPGFPVADAHLVGGKRRGELGHAFTDHPSEYETEGWGMGPQIQVQQRIPGRHTSQSTDDVPKANASHGTAELTARLRGHLSHHSISRDKRKQEREYEREPEREAEKRKWREVADEKHQKAETQRQRWIDEEIDGERIESDKRYMRRKEQANRSYSTNLNSGKRGRGERLWYRRCGGRWDSRSPDGRRYSPSPRGRRRRPSASSSLASSSRSRSRSSPRTRSRSRSRSQTRPQKSPFLHPL